jgi:hypothetical protein
MRTIIGPQRHPSSLNPDAGIPNQSLPNTPRHRTLAIIETSIKRGDILEIGTTAVRVLRQRDEFQEGEDWFEALQTGLARKKTHHQLPSHHLALNVYKHLRNLFGQGATAMITLAIPNAFDN